MASNINIDSGNISVLYAGGEPTPLQRPQQQLIAKKVQAFLQANQAKLFQALQASTGSSNLNLMFSSDGEIAISNGIKEVPIEATPPQDLFTAAGLQEPLPESDNPHFLQVPLIKHPPISRWEQRPPATTNQKQEHSTMLPRHSAPSMVYPRPAANPYARVGEDPFLNVSLDRFEQDTIALNTLRGEIQSQKNSLQRLTTTLDDLNEQLSHYRIKNNINEAALDDPEISPEEIPPFIHLGGCFNRLLFRDSYVRLLQQQTETMQSITNTKKAITRLENSLENPVEENIARARLHELMRMIPTTTTPPTFDYEQEAMNGRIEESSLNHQKTEQENTIQALQQRLQSTQQEIESYHLNAKGYLHPGILSAAVKKTLWKDYYLELQERRAAIQNDLSDVYRQNKRTTERLHLSPNVRILRDRIDAVKELISQ